MNDRSQGARAFLLDLDGTFAGDTLPVMQTAAPAGARRRR
ncbi:hypothetical protein ABH931_005237 [Streptacidiphilus sp. MAP12-33]